MVVMSSKWRKSLIQRNRSSSKKGSNEAWCICFDSTILFDAVAATLKTIAADPRHLGGEIGFLAILHTWGQALTHHPHIHCLVPGGALADGQRWIACRPRFFLPIHVLSRLFRRMFLERLETAHSRGCLRFSGTLAKFDDSDVFAAAVRRLRRKNWVV